MNPSLTGPLLAGVALAASVITGLAVLAISIILWRKAAAWGVRRGWTFGLIVLGLVQFWRAGMIWVDGTVTVGGLVNLVVISIGAVAVLCVVTMRTLRKG